MVRGKTGYACSAGGRAGCQIVLMRVGGWGGGGGEREGGGIWHGLYLHFRSSILCFQESKTGLAGCRV